MIETLEMPTNEEIKRWVTDTIRHAMHIEFYLERLQVGRSDIQRPHDLVGHGNKLEWPAIRGFSMQYRKTQGVFEHYVKPALDFHRQQYHHLAWNEFNPTAAPDAMRLGAVDAVCSLLEPRGYQGGCHSWSEIDRISENNPIHKVAWMLLVSKEMQKVEKPDIQKITLDNIPNLGISVEKHEIVVQRSQDVIKMLKQDHGIIII